MGNFHVTVGVANNDLGDEPLLRNLDADTGERGPVAVPQDLLGRLALAIIRALLPRRGQDPLRQPRAATLVRTIRRHIGLIVLCTILCVPVATWSVVRGVQTYLETERPACAGPLRDWLVSYLILQLAWGIHMPSMTLLLLGWSLSAMFLLTVPRGCPELQAFVLEALALQTVVAALLTAAGVAALTLRPLIRRLDHILSNDSTDPDVLALIPVVHPGGIAAEQECVICLSGDDEQVSWRQLPCDHSFHEPCLLEWLAKARRCPVCRLDLHEAYGREGGGGRRLDAVASYVPVAEPAARRGGDGSTPV